MLRTAEIEEVYSTEADNVLDELYIPLLKVSCSFDRVAAYFDSRTFSHVARGLSEFAQKDGKVRLVVGTFCDPKDIDSILLGLEKRPAVVEEFDNDLVAGFSNTNDELEEYRLNTLAYLVAHNKMDVKIALTAASHTIMHSKFGVFRDNNEDRIVFMGSANETLHGLTPNLNFEHISVYSSWIQGHQNKCDFYTEEFEKIWKNKVANMAVIDIPDAAKEDLIRRGSELSYIPDPEREKRISEIIKSSVIGKSGSKSPRKPENFNTREYQKTALNLWQANDYRGILDLATGTGKTLTAIYALFSTYKGTVEKSRQSLFCVISVPYINLADQWRTELAKFNFQSIACYHSKQSWKEPLSNLVDSMKMGAIKFGVVVVVEKTLRTTDFQNCLSSLGDVPIFWIGDECHHHATEAMAKALPEKSRFRLGLSATPFEESNEIRNQRLKDYYADTVFSFPLEQAIEEGFLTPYLYHPHIVELSLEEAFEFVELSSEIGKIMSQFPNSKSLPNHPNLKLLLGKRARLIGSADNKIPKLEEVLKDKKPTSHTLFFCGDGETEDPIERDTFEGELEKESSRQVEVVSNLLNSLGWKNSRFTYKESATLRRHILNNFNTEEIHALVSIKCLDEGIDIPACDNAYIIASSRNSRQFIQRRGRILRLAEGKKSATIHDLITILPLGFEDEKGYAKRLLRSELERVSNFAKMSKNREDSYTALREVLIEYDLAHLI